MKLEDYKEYLKTHSNPPGAQKINQVSPPKTLKVCSSCFTIIGQGKKHMCNKNNFNNNVTSYVKRKSPKTKTNLASNLLKTAVSESQQSLRGATVELKSGSKILPVVVGTPKVPTKEVKFTHENLIRMQTNHNLSDKTIKY